MKNKNWKSGKTIFCDIVGYLKISQFGISRDDYLTNRRSEDSR